MKRDLNLETWKIFSTVAHAGGISSATQLLDMDAPNISRVIAGLEKSLGIPLFDRSSHPMVLTENGRNALEAADRMLSVHKSLIERLTADTESMSGPVRIGVPPALLQSYLLPFFVAFGRKYPDIQLELSEYTAGLPVNFSSPLGQLDAVISYGPDPSHPNYVQIRYGEGGFVACASPTYLAKYGTPETPEDLSRFTGILFNSPIRNNVTALTDGTRTAELRFEREMVFNSALSAKSATLIGAGINPGIADLHCFKEIERGELIPVLTEWTSRKAQLYIYTRPEVLKLKRVRVFIEEYRETIGKLLSECASVMEKVRENPSSYQN